MSKYDYHTNGHKDVVFALAVQCFPHCAAALRPLHVLHHVYTYTCDTRTIGYVRIIGFYGPIDLAPRFSQCQMVQSLRRGRILACCAPTPRRRSEKTRLKMPQVKPCHPANQTTR